MGMQIKIVALGATAVFLSAGSTASADFTHGGPVIDNVDELTGITNAHIAGHDFLIDPASHDAEAAHWSWVSTSPTDFPTITSVSYFIHDHGPGPDAISATQFDRLHDAAAVWNTSGANVVLTEIFSPGTEDIHVHNASTSACGSFPPVLGCAAFSYSTGHNAGGYPPGSGHPAMPGAFHPQHLMTSIGGPQTLTMQTGPSWYSGADPGLIGAGEHDYMTVAIQEFGHHLGLTHPTDPGAGHPDDGTSPMRGTLGTGVANRISMPSSISTV